MRRARRAIVGLSGILAIVSASVKKRTKSVANYFVLHSPSHARVGVSLRAPATVTLDDPILVRSRDIHMATHAAMWLSALPVRTRKVTTGASKNVVTPGRRGFASRTHISASCRDGDSYIVTEEQIEAFERDGYVHIPGVLSEGEMGEVEDPMMKFLRGEVLPEGKDLCDMSGATDRTPEQYTVYNAMLPRRYYPTMQGNIYERRTKSISEQLQRGKAMKIDYDQLLAKRPRSPDSIFAWHQDSAYWPPLQKDPATCTCWLAIDDSTVENGCMRFLPGSNKELEVRKHQPVNIKKNRKDEESSHALCTALSNDDETKVRKVEIKRGDITVHDQRVVHGSGPNDSDGWRRAYVLAFRTEEMVDEERRLGFSHSHNDIFNWDAFHEWTSEEE